MGQVNPDPSLFYNMDQNEIRRELTIIALINLNEDYSNTLDDTSITQGEKEFLISCIYEINAYLDELISEADSENKPIERPKWNQELDT